MSESVAQQDVAEEIPTKAISLWDVLAGILPAVCLSPAIIVQVKHLWELPQTKIALLIWLIVVGIVAWQARGGVSRHSFRMSVSLVLLFVSVVFAAYGVAMWSFNWLHLSAAVLLVAWGLGRCGKRNWNSVAAWGCLLAITLPLPEVYSSADGWLTDWAASEVSTALDAMGYPNFLDGQSLTLQNGEFSTPATTSAKLGLYAVSCCTAIWCWIFSRSFLHSTLLLMLGGISLMMTRFLAMLLVSIGFIHYSADWAASGTIHYVISFGAFGVILLLLLFCDQLLRSLLSPIPSSQPEWLPIFSMANSMIGWPRPAIQEDVEDNEESDESDEVRNFRMQLEQWQKSWYSLDWYQNGPYRILVFVASLGFFLVSLPLCIGLARTGFPSSSLPAADVNLSVFKSTVARDLLPNQINVFRMGAFTVNGKPENEVGGILAGNGTLDAQWIYGSNGNMVMVDLIAPTWSLMPPLETDRTKSAERSTKFHESLKGDDWGYFETRVTSALGGTAYILQCNLSDDLSASSESNSDSQMWPIQRYLSGQAKKIEPQYEIRVSCDFGAPPAVEQFEELRQFFSEVRNSFRSKLQPSILQSNLRLIR